MNDAIRGVEGHTPYQAKIGSAFGRSLDRAHRCLGVDRKHGGIAQSLARSSSGMTRARVSVKSSVAWLVLTDERHD